MPVTSELSIREQILGHLASEAKVTVDTTLDLLARLAWEVQSDPRLSSQLFPGWFLLAEDEVPEDIMKVILIPPPYEFLDCEDFLPPEYLKKGGLDERAVVFALGITGFKLLTGNERPYTWTSSSMVASMRTWMEGIVRPIAELRPDCPEAVSSVIEKAVQRNPSERQQSVAELLRDITAIRG